MKLKLNKVLYFLSFYYFFIVVWWFILLFTSQKHGLNNFLFVFVYGLIPFCGGVFGLMNSKRWGLFHSAMGKALFFLSLGLITWSGGETIWSYYNIVLNVSVPYPSWADASFIISWPFWIAGVIYLSIATGAKYGLRSKHGKIQLLLVPILAFIISYYLLVTIARQGILTDGNGALKIFFDIAYPVLDVIVLVTAALVYGLSFRFLGGRFKLPVILLLFTFVINYFADFSFSYTTTVGTYYNGNYSDLLFATAMFILSFGVNSFILKDD